MNAMKPIFQRLIKALKSNGVWYSSFKLGQGEIVSVDGRTFTSFDEECMREFVGQLPALEILEMTTSEDARPDHKGEYWLNIIMRKQ
jgi:hypothetical protein